MMISSDRATCLFKPTESRSAPFNILAIKLMIYNILSFF